MNDKKPSEVEHETEKDSKADFTCVVDELFEFVDDGSAKGSRNPQSPPLIPLIVERPEGRELAT
jgi:hypothetical protein